MRLAVANRTRGTLPRVPFSRIARAVLPAGYELSLAFLSESESRRLNRALRGKDTPANVLAFPLSSSSGEVVIAPAVARRGARAFSLSYRRFVGLLFIHALLHLRGHRHGSRMEGKERALLDAFVP